MKKKVLFLFIIFSTLTYAQKNDSWTLVDKFKVNPSEKIRKSNLPSDYKLYTFDYVSFVQKLVNVPQRDTFTGVSNVIVSIPHPNGEIVTYRIVEASTFEPSLQAQFPEIRSFAGQSVKNPGDVIRFSVSPSNGISAIIRSVDSEDTFIIDPFSLDNKTFIVFAKSKASKSGSFNCSTVDAVREFGPSVDKAGNNNVVLNNADDAKLRVFRMAQSCTGEYANYFGATSSAQVALVMAAFNATYTRCNAVFEMDFNCTMQLIANTTSVIYYNPATDPYSDSATGAGGAWNNELGATLQSVIGNANYDIGHLFGADGGGGNAGCIGCVCSADNSKGKGFTSPADAIPEGDTFDIDYVAHEIGHQLGGNHTFSMSTENNSVNMEPGSGITIMGYAGITGATDVAAHSIPIFHAGSIQQITNNIKGKTCPAIVNIANAVPVPSAPATKTLPIGTAFKLTGTATDANAGDVLSYCWEQVDDATTVGAAASYPSGTKTNGANFRSYMPENAGTRYFPRLVDHLANGVAGNQWEVVPTINRTLNFRLTVRDNKPGGGNNESVNTAVTFDDTKGPFTVTSQNTSGINYTQGSTQTVTWTVNSTNTMTGAANVNIKLSTDGGLTYPTMLLANTPNDGTQTVTIPNVFAPYCRILIEPTGNDFYAINTTDFAIGYSITTICTDYTRTLTTGNIITDQNPLAYQNFVLNIPLNAVISDVNVTSNVTHGRRNQLYAGINSPAGTFVPLFQDGGCNNAISDLVGTFDSESGTAAGCGADNNFGTMQPISTLQVLNGQNANGNWLFRVADVTADTRDGVLNSFTFTICYKQVVETPVACGAITSTWNGTSWSNGVPVRNVAAIFAGNYTSTADLEACSVTVNTGVNVTFVAGHTLIVGNGVTVNGTGTLTINNNAALRQIDANAVNSGNIIVKRNSAGMVRLDYTAWSSPVSGQQLQAFSPSTLPNRFYEYLYTGTTTPTAYQVATATNNFTKAKGYMIRAANDWPTTSTVFNGQFTGVPYNGDTTVSLGKGYNLLGNPYASPMNATKFLDDNPSTVGALYFWTHTAPAVGGVYPVNNYASFTKLGGTASAAGGAVPNGTIQTGQGFFVLAYDFGTAKFTNLQRVNASVSTQFFRNSNNEVVETSSDPSRIWLNLNDATNNYNQILVGYMNGATNGIDFAIDGEVLDKESTMLYNVINDTEYVIQGKGLPFANTDEIALGLKATTAGTYNISLENVDGLFTSQDVFLKDNVTNITHNIKQAPYEFTTTEGVFNNRFKLVFTNTVLGNDTFISDESVVVFTQNEELKINATQEIASVEVFDVLGRNIYNNKNVNEKELNITSIANRNQALLVKITFTTGQSVTKKVIK
ncbi:reprolysin-like metallopeptidase [Flavobacterium urocaniciphilum]|uniref:Proprotein convertase P-domain-containing protein n=1 Tax=Flavobacterium urocaniciphilum TaxID=1299341 RepID=A0A1H9BJC1_9FLAO|nr:zinc-dependent metalloprotease family protein [Flavobacterium urocaniciphilum]SEP88831.1 Proprotein convertase P-domain-containing protein [Flavobacterium urocaniciphilum]